MDNVLSKSFYLLIKSIIIALVSAYFISIWDIASIFPFVEAKRTYIISNIIYLAIFSFVFSVFEEIYNSNCAKYEIYFSPDREKRDVLETPTVNFLKGATSFNLDISLEGKENTFKKRKIEIHFPSWVTIQPEISKKYFVSVNKDVCYIDLSKLFNEKSKERNTATSKINISLLIKEEVSDQSKTISTQVTGGNILSRKFFTKVKKNKMKIKLA